MKNSTRSAAGSVKTKFSVGFASAPRSASNKALARLLAPDQSDHGRTSGAAHRIVLRKPNRSYSSNSSAADAKRTRVGAGPSGAPTVYDNFCIKAASSLYDSAEKVFHVGEELGRKVSDGSITEPTLKNFKELSDNVKSIKSAYEAMAENIEKLQKRSWDFSSTDPSYLFREGSVDVFGCARGAQQFVMAVPATNKALDDFSANPNLETAEAWAASVTTQFSNAAGVLDGITMPGGLGAIRDYYSGLLKAPEKYVQFFLNTMKERYGRLDKEVGMGNRGESFRDSTGLYSVRSDTGRLVRDSWLAPGGNVLYPLLVAKFDDYKSLELTTGKRKILAAILELPAEKASQEMIDGWHSWILSYEPRRSAGGI